LASLDSSLARERLALLCLSEVTEEVLLIELVKLFYPARAIDLPSFDWPDGGFIVLEFVCVELFEYRVP